MSSSSIAYDLFIVLPEIQEIIPYHLKDPNSTFQIIISDLQDNGKPHNLTFYNGYQSLLISPSFQVKLFLTNHRSQITFWDARQHDVPPNRPLRFQALANEALGKGMISTGRYAEYLGITRREAMRQVEQDATRDAEVQITNP